MLFSRIFAPIYSFSWIAFSFFGKNRIFATFRFNTQYASPESEKHFSADFHDNPSFLGKICIVVTFRFNIQYTFPESRKRFFASKMSNSDSPHVFTPKEVIPKKIFHLGSPLPYCVVPPDFPEMWFWGRNFKIFRFSLQYTHLFPWIRVKEAFSLFGNAWNRFFAWF